MFLWCHAPLSTPNGLRTPLPLWLWISILQWISITLAINISAVDIKPTSERQREVWCACSSNCFPHWGVVNVKKMFGKPSQFIVGLIGGMHNGGYTVGYCMPVHGVVMCKWVCVIVYICHMWGHNLSSNSKYSAYWHSVGFVVRFCCALHVKSTSQSNHCCLYRWKALKCKPRPCLHQVSNCYLVVYMQVSCAKRHQVCNNDWCHCKTKFRRVPPV